MTDPRDGLSDRERRLGEIVFGYLESAERGEAPPANDWLAAHAEFAAELREFLEHREIVERATGPVRNLVCGFPSGSNVGLSATTGWCGAAGAEEPPLLPYQIAGYELLEELGRGGMGVVYKARQANPCRLVALKMIRPDRLPSQGDVQRFLREVEAVAALDHPNIVPVYEVGRHEGRSFYTMKLIEGSSLDGQLGRFCGAPKMAVRLVSVVAAAVCHAHRRGIIHRDIKPSNILLDADSRPYLVDFGLARHIEDHLALTETGQLLGTPSYLAPERIRGGGKQATSATDVYGLGAVLYSLLAGRPPFWGENLYEVLEQVARHPPASLRRLNRRVDRDLETICLKCLEKAPEKRYACVGELSEDLGRWLERRPVRARRAGPLSRPWGWCQRNPLACAAVSVVLLLVTALIVVLVAGRIRVERYRQITQRHLYAANIRLAQIAWKNGDIAETRELLSACRPALGQPDLRRFEWYYLWGLVHGQRRTFSGHTGGVYMAVFSPDGQMVASAGQDGTARLWDAASGQLLGTLRGHGAEVNAVAISPDGRMLATIGDGNHDRTVWLWDAKVPGPPVALSGHKAEVSCLAFSPRDDLLASGDTQYVILLWDLRTRQARRVLQAPFGQLHAMAFSPDGSMLATAGDDRLVRLWDAASGEERARMLGHTEKVHAVAFSPDGLRLASGGLDGVVRVWDLTTRRELLVLDGPAGGVRCLRFSPDGEVLAAGGHNTPQSPEVVWLWFAHPQQ